MLPPRKINFTVSKLKSYHDIIRVYDLITNKKWKIKPLASHLLKQ